MIDQKIISWVMKGSVEYNKVGRDIDPSVLCEAMSFEYRDVFKEIIDYFSRYKTPPSFEILKEELIKSEDLYLLVSEIEDVECDESEILFYVDKIRKRYNSQLAHRLSQSISDNPDLIDVEEFNSNLKSINSKVERLKRTSILAEGAVNDSVDERINRYLFIEENPESSAGVLSHFPELDNFTNGIQKSEMMLIVGASSSGKSLFLMNYGINAWLGSNNPLHGKPTADNGKNVLYVSLEMSKHQLELRVDANAAEIRHKALTRGFLTNDEKERWRKTLEFQKKYDKKFYIVDMPRGSRTLDIEAKYDVLLSEFVPDLVIVDYLGIMSPNKDFGSDWLEVGNVAADLHEFCRAKNIPVISAAQRKTKNKNAKVQAQDTEEAGRSKMIGDNTNIMVLIETREDERLREDVIFHVVKNRDGEKGEFKLFKEFEKSKFKSIPDNWTVGLGEENEIK